MQSEEKMDKKSKEVCINPFQQSLEDTLDKTMGNSPKKVELAFQNHATMSTTTLVFAISAIAIGCALGNAVLNELNLPHIKNIDHSKAKVPCP